jgi:hypothetical protein
MSDLKRTVPKSLSELKIYLDKIAHNQSHVRGVNVNLTNAHLEIVLDGAAHFVGNPDVYLPIKRAKVTDAKLLVERMTHEMRSGYAASSADAAQLYDMIDPLGQ